MKTFLQVFSCFTFLLFFTSCKKDSDANNCNISKQSIQVNGTLMENIYYTYDKGQLKTRESNFYQTSTLVNKFISSYEYSNDKLTKLLTSYNSVPAGEFRYNYDASGKLLNVQSIRSGQIASIQNFHYNDGKLIRISARKENGFIVNEYDLHFTYTGDNITFFRFQPFPTGGERRFSYTYTSYKNTLYSDPIYTYQTDNIFRLPLFLSGNLVAKEIEHDSNPQNLREFSYEMSNNDQVKKVTEKATLAGSTIIIVTENSFDCK